MVRLLPAMLCSDGSRGVCRRSIMKCFAGPAQLASPSAARSRARRYSAATESLVASRRARDTRRHVCCVSKSKVQLSNHVLDETDFQVN